MPLYAFSLAENTPWSVERRLQMAIKRFADLARTQTFIPHVTLFVAELASDLDAKRACRDIAKEFEPVDTSLVGLAFGRQDTIDWTRTAYVLADKTTQLASARDAAVEIIRKYGFTEPLPATEEWMPHESIGYSDTLDFDDRRNLAQRVAQDVGLARFPIPVQLTSVAVQLIHTQDLGSVSDYVDLQYAHMEFLSTALLTGARTHAADLDFAAGL